jgi:hypothetical protein
MPPLVQFSESDLAGLAPTAAELAAFNALPRVEVPADWPPFSDAELEKLWAESKRLGRALNENDVRRLLMDFEPRRA